ncbi:HlyD family efflux transporter periplasmic adaptor subunit [Burkholderia sp. Ax-1724]|uniref:efflux RND transporter periplasmic adaptor subunit n=2 Tax=Burkholderiaceae TaxID=119060 RepID=UPI0014213593|nr:HlyD family efflux transporter periplasmic adaptor subunit [Burkholderia sp. Ax-1724]NIF52054.1 HlyD family efflux transporter periplasmic adaptor subunit [Burkholderia sp. Ax-1724]
MSESGMPEEAAQQVRIDGQQLALLWQLAARARAAHSEAALGFTIVNETLSLVPYRQSAWWRGSAPGTVAAVSGLPQSDPNAPYVQWLNALCKALARGAPSAPADAAARVEGHVAPVLPARAQVRTFTAADLEADAPHVASDWSAWWPAHGAWLPLTDRAGHALGGVVFAREAAWSATDCALLTELGQVWAHAFEAFAPRASWLERARAVLRPGRQQRRVLIGLAVACVIPLRLTVLAPAEVTPKDPFVVRAPLDGVIDRLYVKPNQPVQRGTPLLGLDATALQSRYALARKDFDAEQEEFRQTAQLAVTDDRTRLDMAERKGKLDQSQVQLDYTAQQLARVKVNAERAGVAVFSDPNEWTGKAVAVGEKILLLADPARVELTAWLPVADNIDVKPGATLTLYPKSSPLSSYEARIDSIAYRAEPTPDGVLAYRVRASFVAADANAPLGAMGTARIRGPWVPAIYYVLRRPLTLARQWLGW